jgi:antitoxin HigA-1
MGRGEAMKKIVIKRPAKVEDTIKKFGMSKKRVKKIDKMVKKIVSTPRDPNRLAPCVSVGEILTEEFLKPLNMSVEELADKMDMSSGVLAMVVSGVETLHAEDAIRLGKALKTTPQFWLNVRNNYDAWTVQKAMTLKTKKRKRG